MTPPAGTLNRTSDEHLRTQTHNVGSTVPLTRKRTATKLAAVVAVSENGVIGCNGELPWRLKTDLRRFRDLTTGHAVIVGRKTYESIGFPLPNRTSIVLSHGPWKADSEDVVVANSFLDAVALAEEARSCKDKLAFVIGGGQVYRLALPYISQIHLTRVHTSIDGDASFPELPADEWRLVSSEKHPADENNEHAYTFEVWDRVRG